MEFWDTEGKPEKFDFDKEKQKLIDNMDFLYEMSVEEQTLYKKWVELNEPSMIADKYNIVRYYDKIWQPTDIYDEEQTLKELESIKPYVQLVDEDLASEWIAIRRLTHTMEFTANPGRNVKAFVKDETSGKILGLLCLGSDITALGVRDDYIGWSRKDRFEDGMLRHTAIGTTIMGTQPLGYNFLGGKLAAMMLTTKKFRDHWESYYGDKLIAIQTTSLYGIHSMYNGIPHYKTMGTSKGKINIKPDDKFYEPWHQWLKENRSEWYEEQIIKERIRNGESMGTGDGPSGPVSGIKQKILSKIFRECDIKSTEYNHGFKRGVYMAMMYHNGPEFLRQEISEDELNMKTKFEEDVEYIDKWWKRKAKRRYKKLLKQDRIKPEVLFYADGIGTDWEEFKDKYFNEVGR